MNLNAGTGTTGPTLTMESLMKTVRDLEGMIPRQPSLFDGLFRPTLGGMDVYIEPEVPAIQVRDIKLKDGTSILSKEFRDETNVWLIARFGYRESLCKDKVLLLGNYGIMMSRRSALMISNVGV